MTVLGVDVGLDGAVAVIDEKTGALKEIHDLPCLTDGAKNRRTINAPLLAAIIFKSCATQAYVELVSSRRGEGGVSAFAFGRSRGLIEGILAASGVPCSFITPASWKKYVGLKPGSNKDASRAMVLRKWPNRADLFKRIKDHNRADACLIALAGIKRNQEDQKPKPSTKRKVAA